MKKTIKMLLYLAAFSSATLLAQDNQSQASPRTIRTPATLTVQVPAPDEPAGLTKIYSNLGPKKDAYNAGTGFVVDGPNSGDRFVQFVGMPFTPKSDATVTQIRAALQYLSGANQVNLSLYSDGGGAPGKLLAGPVTVTDLTGGGCCSLATATFSSGVAVIAGTQYWVVADTPASGAGSDFKGVWDFIFRTHLSALSSGGPFRPFSGPETEPAGAVYGTVP